MGIDILSNERHQSRGTSIRKEVEKFIKGTVEGFYFQIQFLKKF
jgi:hypothetical protein